ncbi:hypothetical protein ElyMa_004074100 [Elysia marginata]|uniref:Uncharacterized protein n=1 Tax=Elysia marginata TaxID=1093978 RepID=A0AAV4G961_9GAST|nr:hypothetical protein ElyMa_004074100 [Elysia marginata]
MRGGVEKGLCSCVEGSGKTRVALNVIKVRKQQHHQPQHHDPHHRYNKYNSNINNSIITVNNNIHPQGHTDSEGRGQGGEAARTRNSVKERGVSFKTARRHTVTITSPSRSRHKLEVYKTTIGADPDAQKLATGYRC